MTPASQEKVATIWAVIGGIGLLMVVLPFVAGIRMDAGGGAMLLIGILIVFTAIIVTPLYRSRAKLIRSITNPENVLARWDTDGDEIQSTIISRDGLLSGKYLYSFADKGGGLRKVRVTLPKNEDDGKVVFLLEDAYRKNSTHHEFTVLYPAEHTAEIRLAADQLKAIYSLK